MTDSENKSVRADGASQGVRRFIERLIFSAIAIGIALVYFWLDPDGQLILYVVTLWENFKVSVKQNWLIYLAVLFILWLGTSLAGDFFRRRTLSETETAFSTVENLPAIHSSVSMREKTAGERFLGSLIVFLDTMNVFIVLVMIVYAVFVSILINPIGKLMNGLDGYIFELGQNLSPILNGICGLVGLGVLWLAISSIKDYFSIASRAERQRPNFFEEMQETLQSILLPMDFVEKTHPAGLTKSVTFSRDRLIVELWYDVRDEIYYVDASSKYSIEEREKALENAIANSKASGDLDQMEFSKFNVKDFSVEDTILHADTFKDNAISKLKRWLAANNVGREPEYFTKDDN